MQSLNPDEQEDSSFYSTSSSSGTDSTSSDESEENHDTPLVEDSSDEDSDEEDSGDEESDEETANGTANKDDNEEAAAKPADESVGGEINNINGLGDGIVKKWTYGEVPNSECFQMFGLDPQANSPRRQKKREAHKDGMNPDEGGSHPTILNFEDGLDLQTFEFDLGTLPKSLKKLELDVENIAVKPENVKFDLKMDKQRPSYTSKHPRDVLRDDIDMMVKIHIYTKQYRTSNIETHVFTWDGNNSGLSSLTSWAIFSPHKKTTTTVTPKPLSDLIIQSFTTNSEHGEFLDIAFMVVEKVMEVRGEEWFNVDFHCRPFGRNMIRCVFTIARENGI